MFLPLYLKIAKIFFIEFVLLLLKNDEIVTTLEYGTWDNLNLCSWDVVSSHFIPE